MRQSVIFITLLFIAIQVLALNDSPKHTPDNHIISAQPIAVAQKLPETIPSVSQSVSQSSYTQEQLKQDPIFTQYLLNRAIEKNNSEAIQYLLEIYRTFPHTDPILIKFAEAKLAKNRDDYATSIDLYREILAEQPLLTPVRIELAIALFNDQQNKAAQQAFELANKDPNMPQDIRQFTRLYLNTLDRRNRWNIDFGVNYTRESNVNNASKDNIFYFYNVPFSKNDSMLPKTAHGVEYRLNISRDFNLFNHHYVHFGNLLYGKNYWDNHDYDEIINRTYLGYVNKSAVQRWAVLPFYERQWYGNHRYKWGQGVRAEYNRWFAKNWQISTALEYSKQRYHQYDYLNGNNKLVSATLLWRRTSQQYFYFGGDISREQTAIRNYSYQLRSGRIGWGQDWGLWQLSSRVSFSYGKRSYKENLMLGRYFIFDKKRKDEIYTANASLWKRDWQLWGITPKLNFSWKKQDSNFDSLYSYIERNVNVVFEKTF